MVMVFRVWRATGLGDMFYFCLVETDLCRPHLEWLPGETVSEARRYERHLPGQLRKLTATHIYADDERVDIVTA